MSDRIIFALIGAIVGSLVSGLFVGKHCRKLCDERISDLEAENKQLRARLKKEKALGRKEKELREDETEIDVSLLNQMTMAREERRKAARKADEMVKDLGYSKEDEDEEDEDLEYDWDDDGDGESVVLKKPVEIKKPSFKMLTQEEYEEDYEYRDVESLVFYQQDQILADACDEYLANATEIVGENAVDIASDTQEDFIYVLDEVDDKMYEIEINHEESFYRDILRGGEL